MTEKKVPDIVIGRLPIYLRALTYMAQEGKTVTSSKELGKYLGISAAQIRKDLSMFGEFGKQGTGYNIPFLTARLTEILNIQQPWDVALVGAGDLGHALARYQGFQQRGFRITMIFDNDPAKIGTRIGDFVVRDVANLEADIRQADIQIAMITVPASAAQEITDRLVQAGVKAILNYAPIQIHVPQGVQVQYIDPSIHLQRMTYYLKR